MSNTKRKFVLRIPLRGKLKKSQNKENRDKNDLNGTGTIKQNGHSHDDDNKEDDDIVMKQNDVNDNDNDNDSDDNDIEIDQEEDDSDDDDDDSDDDSDDDDDDDDDNDNHNGDIIEDNEDSDDMHDFNIKTSKQLENSDIYTDEEEEDDDDEEEEDMDPFKKYKKRINKKNLRKINNDKQKKQIEIEKEIQREKERKEEKRKLMEAERLRIVDREYEDLMSNLNHKLPSNQFLKICRQKELEMISINDENNWIQNEKHAISMRHISIRDDKKKSLNLFAKESLKNQQFDFIKVNLETYFKLKNNVDIANLFDNLLQLNQLQLNQLFNINDLNQDILNKITSIINNLEQFIMEKHFKIQKNEKTVKFGMENYQKNCNSIKNKLESCPILYILLLNELISFNDLLLSDMTEICCLIINCIIRKKIQKKFESLVKKENAKSVENQLFQFWTKNRKEFINNNKNTKSDKEEIDTNNDNIKKNEVEIIENFNKILHDKYPNYCSTYLRFLMSNPNYRNAIISGNIKMNKIFQLKQEQLSNPPLLKIPTNENQDINRKRKHFGVNPLSSSPATKRRKLSSNNIDTTNAKERIIWDGLLINDSVKCHIRMKQIGGKSIWTLPFKNRGYYHHHHHHHHKHNKSHQQQQQLSIGGRINILSIIKFIKQLRKHKTRRILFAEIESNEYVNHNSYNILSSQLSSGGRAGVIDFEKQCGILIYIVSSAFLSPTNAMSHQLNKYFDGHKAKLPSTKIFAIIILSMDTYNQVKRKVSKSKHNSSNGSNNNNINNNNNNKHNHDDGIDNINNNKPLKPPTPKTLNINNKNEDEKKQTEKKTNNDDHDDKKQIDDVWNKISDEIEDDLGDLPPPLPPHLLAERERYKKQQSQSSSLPLQSHQSHQPPQPPPIPTQQVQNSSSPSPNVINTPPQPRPPPLPMQQGPPPLPPNQAPPIQSMAPRPPPMPPQQPPMPPQQPPLPHTHSIGIRPPPMHQPPLPPQQPPPPLPPQQQQQIPPHLYGQAPIPFVPPPQQQPPPLPPQQIQPRYG